MDTVIRPASVRDIPTLALFFMSEGVVEWLYRGAIPDRPTNVIVEHLFTRFGTPMAFTNCHVADAKGRVLGGVHIALGRDLAEAPADLLVPEERRPAVAPFGRLRTPDAMHVLSVNVEPQSRGRGIGKMLLTEAETRAKLAGVRKMSLNVREDNIGAMRLYTRLGYREAMRESVVIPNVFDGAILHMIRVF